MSVGTASRRKFALIVGEGKVRAVGQVAGIAVHGDRIELQGSVLPRAIRSATRTSAAPSPGRVPKAPAPVPPDPPGGASFSNWERWRSGTQSASVPADYAFSRDFFFGCRETVVSLLRCP
jgi:hypothetical protein